MITKIKFPKSFKKQVYEAFHKSKKISKIYEIHGGVLYVHSSDVEQSLKIFDRLVLNCKIIKN